MTKEQIEELSGRAKDHESYENWCSGEEIARLLEERQRLLDAARTGLRIGMQRDASPSAPDEDCARIVAAIAFAEQEAK